MQLILIILGFILYSILEGKRDAHLEDARTRLGLEKRINLHPLFTIERVLLGILIYFYTSIFRHNIGSIIFTVSLGLIFSWFHNGMYYLTRNNLNRNIYKKRWFDHSTTSKALIELTFEERTFLLLLGISLLTIVL